jgi:dihydrofolate synthase/folylpolyglutamate synthase
MLARASGQHVIRRGHAYLASLANFERSVQRALPDNARMRPLLSELSNPHTRFPAIHVTGTNGKGSTSAMAAALLSAHGYRVGLYTSPHIVSLTERIQIDGDSCSEEELDNALCRVSWAAARAGVTPSWFEAITAAAFTLLADAAIDVGVIEVGLLGRLDATNVLDADVVVVTNIGMDHSELVDGDRTRASVAQEKAAIVRPGSTLILGESDIRLRPAFERRRPATIVTAGADTNVAIRKRGPEGATVDITTPARRHRGVQIGMLGDHQAHNASLAVAAAEALLSTPLVTSLVSAELQRLSVPGRAEITARQPLMLLDGAHNREAASALAATIADYLPAAVSGAKVLVCGFLSGRDPRAFLDRLAPSGFDALVATTPRSPRAIPAAHLCRAVPMLSRPGSRYVADPAAAVDIAIAAADVGGLVVVTGSLYLISQVRPRLVSRSPQARTRPT